MILVIILISWTVRKYFWWNWITVCYLHFAFSSICSSGGGWIAAEFPPFRRQDSPWSRGALLIVDSLVRCIVMQTPRFNLRVNVQLPQSLWARQHRSLAKFTETRGLATHRHASCLASSFADVDTMSSSQWTAIGACCTRTWQLTPQWSFPFAHHFPVGQCNNSRHGTRL